MSKENLDELKKLGTEVSEDILISVKILELKWSFNNGKKRTGF